MKMIHLAVASLLLVATAMTAQEVHLPAARSAPATPAVEAKVRKVWEDFKSKNKQGLSSSLAEGFREMEEGGSGLGDKKAEIAMVDEFELSSYLLKDFTVKSLGLHSVLVTPLTTKGQPRARHRNQTASLAKFGYTRGMTGRLSTSRKLR